MTVLYCPKRALTPFPQHPTVPLSRWGAVSLAVPSMKTLRPPSDVKHRAELATSLPMEFAMVQAGCCETALLPTPKFLGLYLDPFGNNKSDPAGFSNCGYTFVVEKGGYSFKRSDIEGLAKKTSFSMRLEYWAVGEGRCAEAVGSTGYVCGTNSRCMESERGSGYLCGCLDGFRGNPYLNGSLGCQDINECSDDNGSSPCVSEATCINEVPFFKCACQKGYSGDGRRDGSKCVKRFPVIQAVVGAITCFGGIMLGFYLFFWALKKRKLIKHQAKCFKKNGGILLQQHLSCNSGFAKCTRIYSVKELSKATNEYSSGRTLGGGGYGTVYKGVLNDGTVVAIKKSQSPDESKVDQFINEIIILTQINHKNVVKLLGCCLETEVPLLVYEFISNGSLYQRIHENVDPHISWKELVRIAIDIAEALSYLHYSTSTPIYHRDVKSSNILLDKNYTAKIADFGLSKLVPVDKSKLSTEVQGTFGYLDPEYFQTGKLTEKSDVYSFGVVLLELYTGRKPIWTDPSMENCDLITFFLSCISDNNLLAVFKAGYLIKKNLQDLEAFANIVRRCLSENGKERPTMKEVLQDLHDLEVESVEHLQQIEKEEYEES